MSTLAVRAEGLGKQYAIGRSAGPAKFRYSTLRESLLTSLRQIGRRSATPPPTFWALRDVSFEVKTGEVVGIIGRNGAGKSTLLKILSRITEPTTGQAEVFGRVGSLLEVGTGFHPELTGRENVFLNGAILGMPRRDIARKFDEIVAFAEIGDFLDTAVRHYSSGMYMRLAFSVAAHLEPDVLVVDEVLAVGDVAFQQKCLGKMEQVSSEGRTVLFVSHNMAAITRLCSRALLLDQGHIVADGTSTEVVGAYLQGALGKQHSASWPDLATAPGNDRVRMRFVEMLDDRGGPASVVSVGQSLLLRIGYHVLQPDTAFRASASFFTQGACAFSTVETTELPRVQVGEYVSEVEIPGHLLAEGSYSVSVSLFSSRGRKQHLAMLTDLLTFQVYDPMDGTSARGDYAEGLAGVVRPRLRWQMRPEDVASHPRQPAEARR